MLSQANEVQNFKPSRVVADIPGNGRGYFFGEMELV